MLIEGDIINKEKSSLLDSNKGYVGEKQIMGIGIRMAIAVLITLCYNDVCLLLLQ